MTTQPPGFLDVGSDPDFIMMICTAGHVDHGKTSLVKHLTGCDTDRLKAEKERGLTIELGFAPCTLGKGLSVGIVDVPGHEKFIKNMVSGVPGIDLAVLTIAVDDGIMPQTVEHFQIMELLGVRDGIVALTKIDLVSPERVEERIAEVREFLAGSFMADAPICPVSSETFEGIFDFHHLLVERIKKVEKKQSHGIFRMPIERLFIQQGFGIVASGIPLDGNIEVGSRIEIVPGHVKGRIKGIQRFGRNAEQGGYGQCLALNIPDVGKSRPTRGQVITLPDYFEPCHLFHVELKTVDDLQRPLKNAEEVKFHTGTSEVNAKLYLLEDKTLERGSVALATVSVTKPIAACSLDQFILRRMSPAVTVGGGRVLSVTKDNFRPKKKRLLEKLKFTQGFLTGVDLNSDEGIERRIELFLWKERPMGATTTDASKGIALEAGRVRQGLSSLLERGRVLPLDHAKAANADCFAHVEAYRIYYDQAKTRIETAASESATLSLTMTELREQTHWPLNLWDRILQDMSDEGLVDVQGNKVVLKKVSEQFNDEDRRLMEKILQAYQETVYSTPRPDVLPERLGADQEKIDWLLEHLINEGKLVRLPKNVVLTYDHFKQAQDKVVQIIKEEGALRSVDFKYTLDTSRKYALAILDYLDEQTITMHLDKNRRTLTPFYESHLL